VTASTETKYQLWLIDRSVVTSYLKHSLRYGLHRRIVPCLYIESEIKEVR
jgi:hypothetical protein